MHRLRKVQIGLITLVLAMIGRSSAEERQEPKIDLKTVKYSELTKEIEALKGKVIVIDYWADT
jgi:hypothetical protein